MTARSTPNKFQLEKDLLRSLKGFRKENFEAKRELKALYDHKLDRLRNNLGEEKRQSENLFKE